MLLSSSSSSRRLASSKSTMAIGTMLVLLTTITIPHLVNLHNEASKRMDQVKNSQYSPFKLQVGRAGGSNKVGK